MDLGKGYNQMKKLSDEETRQQLIKINELINDEVKRIQEYITEAKNRLLTNNEKQ